MNMLIDPMFLYEFESKKFLDIKSVWHNCEPGTWPSTRNSESSIVARKTLINSVFQVEIIGCGTHVCQLAPEQNVSSMCNDKNTKKRDSFSAYYIWTTIVFWPRNCFLLNFLWFPNPYDIQLYNYTYTVHLIYKLVNWTGK